MTLEKYVQNLQTFLAENPSLATAKVVYAKDAEGNGYDTIYWEPTAGSYEDGEFDPEAEEADAVCIN